jgi:hypothetical protein
MLEVGRDPGSLVAGAGVGLVLLGLEVVVIGGLGSVPGAS